MDTRKIEKRIQKATALNDQITEAAAEIDPDGRIQELVREDVTTNVLAELLESLKNGESLEMAIMTIQENF